METIIIDTKKIFPDAPKDAYEAIDKMNKAQFAVLDACHIFQSAIMYPEAFEEFILPRMKKFMEKYIRDES